MINSNSKETTRSLRKNSTPAEIIFWEAVRNRKVNGRKFNRQFPIQLELDDKNRCFIADFYCHECRLVVEIDGPVHERQKDYDNLRTQAINMVDIKVIRFTNEDVTDRMDAVLTELMRHL